MPEPTKLPPLPTKRGEGTRKTFVHMNPNAAAVAKIIAAGTRDDHPAVIAAQARAKKAQKGGE